MANRGEGGAGSGARRGREQARRALVEVSGTGRFPAPPGSLEEGCAEPALRDPQALDEFERLPPQFAAERVHLRVYRLGAGRGKPVVFEEPVRVVRDAAEREQAAQALKDGTGV